MIEHSAYPALDYTIIILASCSILASLRTLLRPLFLCQAYTRESTEFASRNFFHKLNFTLNLPVTSHSKSWHARSLAASISILICATLALYPESYRLSLWTHMWMGIAAFFTSLCIPSYFHKVFSIGHYRTIVSTINAALPKILRVLLCFFPIFAGYVVVGTMMFGTISHRFENLGGSCITLFAIANGDEIRATIKSLYLDGATTGALGTIFIVSYLVTFIYVVLTIIISIMEKSYTDVAMDEDEKEIHRKGTMKTDMQRFLRTSTILSD